jgi:malonate transporter
VRPRFIGKILWYLCHLCQILNRLQQLKSEPVQAILNVAFPIFGVILAGYLAGRWRILGGEATTALNAFVSYFALPVLFFGTLARSPVAAVLDPALMVGFGAAVAATFAVGMASTRLVSRGTRKAGLAAMSLQGIAASWGNVGYMGVPLCLAAFGEAGLPPAMLAVIVTSIISMVFGVMLIELEVAAGHGPLKTFLKAAFNVARNPLPMSIALGIAASAVSLPIPVPVEKWLDLMGAAAAPCALFAIGLFLSDKSIKSGLAEAGLATLIKLLLQPLLAALILPMFIDLGSVAGRVALLMAALPTAANAFVLAKQFDLSVEQNTASVLLSTAFSVVTVSALLVWLRVS